MQQFFLCTSVYMYRKILISTIVLLVYEKQGIVYELFGQVGLFVECLGCI